MTDWKAIRDQFPAVKTYTYFDAASAPPIPIPVAQAAQKYYQNMLEKGDMPWDEWLENLEAVRQQVADYLNAEVDEIAFTLSTSHGISLIAQMLDQAGEVISMKDEFPASTLAWLQQGSKIHWVEHSDDGQILLDDIEKLHSSKTKVLVTSHVQYATGFQQNLEELGAWCKSKGLHFIVDASQSVTGSIDVKKQAIDGLALTGYKWLIAGYGIAILYISKKLQEKYPFRTAGWQSMKNPDALINDHLDLKHSAGALELGCSNFPGAFALGASLKLFAEIGYEQVKNRILDLTDYLCERLSEQGLKTVFNFSKTNKSGITIIDVPDELKMKKKLKEQKIIVSSRSGGLRVSPHIYNNETDIDLLVSTIQKEGLENTKSN